jgi:hypothetical protein
LMASAIKNPHISILILIGNLDLFNLEHWRIVMMCREMPQMWTSHDTGPIWADVFRVHGHDWPWGQFD